MIIENYSNIRNRIKTGDILLFKGNSLLSKIISIRSSLFTHSALILNFGILTNRIYSIDITYSGLHLKLLSNIVKQYNGEVYLYTLNNISEEQRSNALDIALPLCAKNIKFDYSSLFLSFFNKVKINRKRYFCSEFVYDVLMRANITSKITFAPTPSDLVSLLDGSLIKLKN